jgi:hypothetical protein
VVVVVEELRVGREEELVGTVVDGKERVELRVDVMKRELVRLRDLVVDGEGEEFWFELVVVVVVPAVLELVSEIAGAVEVRTVEIDTPFEAIVVAETSAEDEAAAEPWAEELDREGEGTVVVVIEGEKCWMAELTCTPVTRVETAVLVVVVRVGIRTGE